MCLLLFGFKLNVTCKVFAVLLNYIKVCCKISRSPVIVYKSYVVKYIGILLLYTKGMLLSILESCYCIQKVCCKISWSPIIVYKRYIVKYIGVLLLYTKGMLLSISESCYCKSSKIALS